MDLGIGRRQHPHPRQMPPLRNKFNRSWEGQGKGVRTSPDQVNPATRRSLSARAPSHTRSLPQTTAHWNMGNWQERRMGRSHRGAYKPAVRVVRVSQWTRDTAVQRRGIGGWASRSSPRQQQDNAHLNSRRTGCQVTSPGGIWEMENPTVRLITIAVENPVSRRSELGTDRLLPPLCRSLTRWKRG